jgi:hypothetical protein
MGNIFKKKSTQIIPTNTEDMSISFTHRNNNNSIKMMNKIICCNICFENSKYSNIYYKICECNYFICVNCMKYIIKQKLNIIKKRNKSYQINELKDMIESSIYCKLCKKNTFKLEQFFDIYYNKL